MLNGAFGMCEMECAVARLVSRYEEKKNRGYSIETMANEHERDGFCHLVEGGYLESTGNYNGIFRLTDAAVARLKQRGIYFGEFHPQT